VIPRAVVTSLVSDLLILDVVILVQRVNTIGNLERCFLKVANRLNYRCCIHVFSWVIVPSMSSQGVSGDRYGLGWQRFAKLHDYHRAGVM
jgi:hypothetical protein